jgi:hypothetical protein
VERCEAASLINRTQQGDAMNYLHGLGLIAGNEYAG